TGPCLSVAVAPATYPLPPILTARSLGLDCFVLPSLPLPAVMQADLAPVGLRLDPRRLFTEIEVVAAQRAITAGKNLQAVVSP
ncbi:MAG TPA: hypothetical protein VHX44_05285, partial [Planctomycetota bacterium]|nr:hypothetical protein [Planctomycetota bacterium]